MAQRKSFVNRYLRATEQAAAGGSELKLLNWTLFIRISFVRRCHRRDNPRQTSPQHNNFAADSELITDVKLTSIQPIRMQGEVPLLLSVLVPPYSLP